MEKMQDTRFFVDFIRYKLTAESTFTFFQDYLTGHYHGDKALMQVTTCVRSLVEPVHLPLKERLLTCTRSDAYKGSDHALH
jgi:hypothetical protein